MNDSRTLIITVDGPAGAGKSTVSRRVARELGLTYLNSGFLYRAVTLLILEAGGRFDDRDQVEQTICELDLRFVEEPDRTRVFTRGRDVTERLKAPDVTPEVWRIANDGGYRKLLVEMQRRFAAPPGVVAEGRDMGTVIFPDAHLKVYLDASAAERARRSLRDLAAAGHERSFEEVLKAVEERDRHDQGREHAPLVVPDGATVLQTDGLDADGVVRELLAAVERVRARTSEGMGG